MIIFFELKLYNIYIHFFYCQNVKLFPQLIINMIYQLILSFKVIICFEKYIQYSLFQQIITDYLHVYFIIKY